LSTNFLSLLSGCFTVPTRSRGLHPPKASYPCINDISAYNFNQRFFALDRAVPLCQYYNQHTNSGSRNRHICGFFMPVSWPYGPFRSKGSLNGIRLLIIANYPEYREAPGALLGVLVVGFFCQLSKLTGGVL
jgi:hypothetical protein